MVSVAVSVYTLTMIAVDRYLAICRPLKFQISATRTITVIVLVWLISFVIMIPNAVFYGIDANEELAKIGKPLWLCRCAEVGLILHTGWSNTLTQTAPFL